MNTEQKAKAYDEALKKAKMYHQNAKEAGDYSAVARYENVFPELTESEDEKIRKSLLAYIKGESKRLYTKEWISYLEKQKDTLEVRAQHITTNMLEDGITGIQRELIEFSANVVCAPWVDIIKSADAYAQRIKSMFEKQKEQKKPVDLVAELKHHLETTPKEQLEKEWKKLEHWNKIGPTVKEFLYGEQKEQKDYRKLYEDIAKSEWFKKAYHGKSLGIEDEQKPVENPFDANETMRMKDRIDEGFTKMMMQEQKPVEWSEDIIRKAVKEVGLTQYQIDWFKTNVLFPPKQEWSEEDETYLQDALWCVEKAEKVAKDENDMGACWCARRLLKSLPSRFNPSKGHGLSKHDEELRKELIQIINDSYEFGGCSINCKETRDNYVNFLEAISSRFNPQPHWKPSEEQMMDLFIAAREGCEAGSPTSNTLKTLYKDLEKL